MSISLISVSWVLTALDATEGSILCRFTAGAFGGGHGVSSRVKLRFLVRDLDSSFSVGMPLTNKNKEAHSFVSYLDSSSDSDSSSSSSSSSSS
jgi:hypothetical protein